jgi:hypothetical protein
LHLAADGRVLVTVPVPAESDLEALTMAGTLKGEYVVELWDGLRFIELSEPAVPASGAAPTWPPVAFASFPSFICTL